MKDAFDYHQQVSLIMCLPDLYFSFPDFDGFNAGSRQTAFPDMKE